MTDYIMILVGPGLLRQVVTELLALAGDPDHVRVTHGPDGQAVLVEPVLADLWYEARPRFRKGTTAVPVPQEPPVKPPSAKRGRPRKAAAPPTLPQPVDKAIEDAAFRSWTNPGGDPPRGEELR
jgi:hypothetical protein